LQSFTRERNRQKNSIDKQNHDREFHRAWDAKLLHVVVHLYWRNLALTCGALNSEGGLMLAAQTDEHCDDMLTWRHVCDPTLLCFGVPWS